MSGSSVLSAGGPFRPAGSPGTGRSSRQHPELAVQRIGDRRQHPEAVQPEQHMRNLIHRPWPVPLRASTTRRPAAPRAPSADPRPNGHPPQAEEPDEWCFDTSRASRRPRPSETAGDAGRPGGRPPWAGEGHHLVGRLCSQAPSSSGVAAGAVPTVSTKPADRTRRNMWHTSSGEGTPTTPAGGRGRPTQRTS